MTIIGEAGGVFSDVGVGAALSDEGTEVGLTSGISSELKVADDISAAGTCVCRSPDSVVTGLPPFRPPKK